MSVTDVRLLLRVASSDALRPRVSLGSAVAVECTAIDQDGAPIPGAVVTLSVVGLLTIPGVVAGANGKVTASFTPQQAGAYAAQADCTAPLAETAQRIFDVIATDGDPELSPPWVDASTGAMIFPPGQPVTAQSIAALPSGGALQAADALPAVRSGAGVKLTGASVLQAASDAGAAAGEEAGGEAGATSGAAAAEPARIDAQAAAGAAGASAAAAAGSAGAASAAAASVAATVANAAVQRETLAALNLVSASDGAIGEVWGNNADRGRYRRSSGAWVYESRSFVTLDIAAPAVATLPATLAWALSDPEGFIALALSLDGSTLLTKGLALSRQSDGTARVARADGAAPIDLQADGTILLGSSARALPDGTFRAGGQTLVDTTIGGWSVGDELGFLLARAAGGRGFEAGGFRFHLGTDGIARIFGTDDTVLVSFLPGGTPSFTGTAPLLTVTHSDFAHVVADDLGFIGLAIRNDGTPVGSGLALPSGVPALPFSAAEIAARNNRNLGLAAAVARQTDPHVARPNWRYSIFPTVGQSLAAGYLGYPALTRSNRYAGLRMLGVSVHSQDEQDTVWTRRGSAVLNPLVGTVASRGDLNTVLTDEQVLALAPDATNRGETILEGALAFLRRSWNDSLGYDGDDPTRLWVAGVCASSGNAIEEISKGATPDRYNRALNFATQVKSFATADGGASFGVGAWFFLQGEANYQGSSSSTSSLVSDSTKAGYKALLKQYRADLRADVEVAIAGMARPAPFITYQTGDSFTRDTNDLAIGMAQWELSDEEPGWYLAAPNYPVTNIDGHLDANGYRWVGQQMGKVATRVLVDGRRWRPLCPVSPSAATLRGREILLDMHVPNPPLVWDLPYVVYSATDYAPSRGFVVVDDAGTNLVISAEIVAETVVKLTLTRACTTNARLRYADLTVHGGRGNLRDSDPTVASEVYEYVGGRQSADANIPALVGKPYPLHNWCIAFSIPLTAG